MWKNFCKNVACFISSEYKKEIDEAILKSKKENYDFDRKVNQRVAEILIKMDPFEPLMKKFNGTFSKEYERVEDALSEQGKISMYMWGWQQKNDINFDRMVNWIMDKAGNSLLKTGNPTELQTFYKRAEIANMILVRREVGRLSSLYEELLHKKKGDSGEQDEV